jgi:hypothetical protein
MTANYSDSEPDDLYSRDFLVRVPKSLTQDSQPIEGRQPSPWLSLMVSGLSMMAMGIYQLATSRVFAWEFDNWILVLITGVAGFALAHIFGTILFGEK